MTLDIAEYVLKGYRFTQAGSVVEVLTPDNRHGSGATPEDAVLNIGATIVPVDRDGYVGRLLTREDGTEVMLDVSGVRQIDAPVVESGIEQELQKAEADEVAAAAKVAELQAEQSGQH